MAFSDQQPTDPERTRGVFQQARAIYQDFPGQFWTLVLATFIDRLGGALLFPFFTLYVTRKFDIGMTQVGVIFALFAISSVVGSMVGGALSDRLGRKGMLLFGLVMSGLSSLLMGYIDRLALFYGVTLLVGLLSNTAGPAQQAMVADLLPEEQRTQGFGVLRVVMNLAVTIGPVIGGLLAAQSYLLLFIGDAGTSLLTAGIVYLAIRESRPEAEVGKRDEPVAQTFGGYAAVLRDSLFIWFLLASALMVMVYMQMSTTLAVYLRDTHGVSERGFGYILSLNAGMVVLFQFSFSRWIVRFRPLLIMAAGTLLYAVGFALYGFVSVYVLFLTAMAVITIGEMLVTPVGQALVTRLAPEDMRGRYMAIYGFTWVIPIAIGPLLAGLVMDRFNPNWLWYLAGMVGLMAAVAFAMLERRVGRSRHLAIDTRLAIMQRVEGGEISAEEAGQLLDGVGGEAWSRVYSDAGVADLRRLRVRILDASTGAMKSDFQIPMGLVNTVLFVGGRLSGDLGDIDPAELESLISRTQERGKPQDLDAGENRVEVSVE